MLYDKSLGASEPPRLFLSKSNLGWNLIHIAGVGTMYTEARGTETLQRPQSHVDRDTYHDTAEDWMVIFSVRLYEHYVKFCTKSSIDRI